MKNTLPFTKYCKILFLLLFVALSNSGFGQVWNYDFGTGTGTANNTNSGSGNTTFFSGTPSGGGTYRVRIGTGGGTLTLVNPGTTLGTASEAQLIAATGTSTNKFGVYSWTNPTSVGYVKLKLRSTSSGTGNFAFIFGSATVGSDSNSIINNYNAALSLLRINYASGAISTVTRRISGSDVTVSSSGLAKDTDQTVEVYANNGATSVSYVRAGTSYSLATLTWDFWVDGARVIVNGATAGSYAAGNALAGFAVFAESSASNAATVYIDDIEYSNALPSAPTYALTYDGNTNTGGTAPATANYAEAATVTVANAGTLVKTGFTFNGWNTAADGSGTAYVAGNTFAMPANAVTLYAQWSAITTPTITTTGTLTALTTTYGTPSATTSFSASGTALTADITVSAPTGFEISTTAGSGYASSLVLTQSAGAVAATTIFVRLAAATPVGSYSGNISLASTGATTVTVATVSSTVTTKSLTINGLTAVAKEYDTTTNVTIAGTPSYFGLVNGETFTVTGTVSYAFATATAGTAKAITRTGTYDVPSTNYTVTQPFFTADITKKALTILGATAQNKNFDGTTTATITGSLDGVISPDVITLNLSGTFANATVGTAKPVTSNSTISSTTNYTLTQPAGLVADIIAITPNAPVIGTITPSSGTLTVNFTAPTNNGGTPITNYAYSTDNGTTFVPVSPAQTTSPIVIAGLTNGVTYPIIIYAINAIGNGANSNTVNGTPTIVTQATDFFRSNSGNTGNGSAWSTATNWESSSDNSAWITATLAPSSTANTITIRSGHNIDITATLTADQIVVETGALLRHSAGTFTIANGTGTDLIVNGTLTKTTTATTTVTGTISFEAGATYNHANSGGLPIASWNVSSTCNITGITSGTPTGMGQAFGIVNWNCTGQSGFVIMGANGAFNPKGLFTVASTNASVIELESNGSGATYNFDGGLAITGGTFIINFATGALPFEATLNINGNLSLSGSGVFDACQGSASASASAYMATINLSGNINLTSSQTYSLTSTATNNYARLFFTGNTNHTYSRTSSLASRYVDFFVPVNNTLTLSNSMQLFSSSTSVFDLLSVSGTLNTNANAVIQSAGTQAKFTVLSGGTIITANTGGLVGAIAVGGTKTFTAGANYVFNGNTTTPYPTGTLGSPASLTFNANVVSNRTSSLIVSGAVNINDGASYTYNSANVNDSFALAGTMTIAAAGVFDSAGENRITNSGGTGAVVVNGTFRTRDAQGFYGSNATVTPTIALTLNSGSIVDYASANQTITTTPNYKNITFSGAGPFNIVPSSVFLFDETANFNGKNVILKSDATGTAAIGQITGTLNGATNVTVERYITGRRAFRFLTPGVTTTTSIFQNWQDNGGTTAGIGTHITGGAANGFDVTATNNPSLHTYNAQATGTTTGFTAATNTDVATLKAGAGYRLLVRGDRNVILSNPSADDMNVPTTLSATGTLTTGTVVFDAQISSPAPVNNNATNTQTNGYTLIGNPYASPVDWNAVAKTGVMNNAYYSWDPTLGTAAQRGRYVVYSADNGQTNLYDDNSTLAQTNRQFLQSGQAVFIKNADLAVPATLTFEESDKATTNSYVFRSADQTVTTTATSKLFLSIYEPTELAIGGAPIDGALALFGTDYSTALDANDVNKLTAAGENVAFVRNTKNLAIETLAPVQANDALYVKTIAFQANKNYTFKVNATDFDATVNAKMVDIYLNTETPLDLTQPAFVNFSTTADANSYGSERFKIVFNSAALGNGSFTNATVSVYPNPILNNQFTIALPSSLAGMVTVRMSNMLGQEVFKTSEAATPTLNIQPKQQLEEGVYVVSISNNGQVVQTKVIVKK